jgi:hypothetical protein
VQLTTVRKKLAALTTQEEALLEQLEGLKVLVASWFGWLVW